jgi:hypothetical protein
MVTSRHTAAAKLGATLHLLIDLGYKEEVITHVALSRDCSVLENVLQSVLHAAGPNAATRQAQGLQVSRDASCSIANQLY